MDIIGIGLWEVLVIMVVLMVVVGPRRLPEITRKLGEMARHFKTVTNEMSRDIERELKDEADDHENQSNDYSVVDDKENKGDRE